MCILEALDRAGVRTIQSLPARIDGEASGEPLNGTIQPSDYCTLVALRSVLYQVTIQNLKNTCLRVYYYNSRKFALGAGSSVQRMPGCLESFMQNGSNTHVFLQEIVGNRLALRESAARDLWLRVAVSVIFRDVPAVLSESCSGNSSYLR